MKPVRVVLDTNVVASALLRGGTPERLIELAGDGGLTLVTSEPLLAEFAGILTRSKFAARFQRTSLSPAEIVASYRTLAEVIEAAPIEETTLADPDDAAVLACALAGNADIIVTGDKRLRGLNSYQGIRIVTVTEALASIASGATGE